MEHMVAHNSIQLQFVSVSVGVLSSCCPDIYLYLDFLYKNIVELYMNSREVVGIQLYILHFYAVKTADKCTNSFCCSLKCSMFC